MKAGAAAIAALVGLTALLTLPAGSVRAMESGPEPVVVAVALPGNQDFWRQCQQAMLDYARTANLELRLVVSNDDQMKQNAQVRQLLAGSPDVLILAAHDALGAAAAVKMARGAKIKVLALDRLTLNADLDLYLAFDHELAGERQAEALLSLAPQGPYVILSGPPNDYSAYLSLKGAMKVLGPLIESGRIQVLADGPILGGRTEQTRHLISRLLARGLRPAAVLAPDDAAADGAILALREAGLAGRVPVAGQNGEPAAVRLLKTGEQGLTLVKDPVVLAGRALDLAVRLTRNEDAEAAVSIDNGFKDVPAVLLTAPEVDRRNLETALKEGLLRPDN